METWGEGGVVYWDSGSCFLSVLCPLGVGGLQRAKNLPFGVVECPGPPWLLVTVTEHLPLMSSLGVSCWTNSAQTGQVAVPIGWLISSQEMLTETLFATFSLVLEGGRLSNP